METVEIFLVKKRPFELFRCSTKTKTKKVERVRKERVRFLILQGRLKGFTELHTLSESKDFRLTGTQRRK